MSKIVVVDDSYAELQMIEGYLKAASHTVVSFPNTDKLEDKLASEKPDLIVMDVVMPGVNGFQATRQIARGETTKDIPVVIVSTKDQATDRVWGKRQGARDYLTKPVDENKLIEVIQQYLNAG